jgi:hypothetical protein
VRPIKNGVKKFQITNIKQITMTEIQNSKPFYVFEEGNTTSV